MVAYGSNLNMITDFHLIIIHFYTLQGLLIYCTTYIMIMSDKNSPHSIMTSQCFGSCPLSQPYMVMTNQTQTRQPSASVPCTALPYWLGMWLLTCTDVCTHVLTVLYTMIGNQNGGLSEVSYFCKYFWKVEFITWPLASNLCYIEWFHLFTWQLKLILMMVNG